MPTQVPQLYGDSFECVPFFGQGAGFAFQRFVGRLLKQPCQLRAEVGMRGYSFGVGREEFERASQPTCSSGS